VDKLEAVEGWESPTALTLLETVCHTPDMYRFYLGRNDDTLGFALQHESEFVDPPSEFEKGFEDWLASVKTARVLYDWIDERDVEEIADRHDVGPGDVHGRVERAEWLLYAAEELAAQVDSSHARIVHETRLRVTHGVRDDVLDLVSVRGIGRVRARRLFDVGVETVGDLREADVDVLARTLGPKTAVNVLDEVGREVEQPEVDVEVDLEADETRQASMGDF
ncbi:MAG: helix-hairpin-helix domain-containing protein, partial [Halobacteriota archaeon]